MITLIHRRLLMTCMSLCHQCQSRSCHCLKLSQEDAIKYIYRQIQLIVCRLCINADHCSAVALSYILNGLFTYRCQSGTLKSSSVQRTVSNIFVTPSSHRSSHRTSLQQRMTIMQTCRVYNGRSSASVVIWPPLCHALTFI